MSRLFAFTLLAAQGPGPRLISAQEAGDFAAVAQALPSDNLLPPEDADEEACRAAGGDACALSLRQLRAQPVAELQAAKTGHGPYAKWESDGHKVTVYRIQMWPLTDRRDGKGADQLTLTEANAFTAACASGMTGYGSRTALILKFEVDCLKMSPHHYCECKFERDGKYRECRYDNKAKDCKNMGFHHAGGIAHCEWYSFPKISQCEGSDPKHLTDQHQQWGKHIWGERTEKRKPCDWMSSHAIAKKNWHCVREKMKGPDGRAETHRFEEVMNHHSECNEPGL